MNVAHEGVVVDADNHAHAPPIGRGAILRNKPLADGVRRALNGIDTVARIVLVTALLSELAVVLTDVSIRFISSESLLWSEEASKLCLTTLAFLGGALSYRAGHHTAIQFVTRFFSLTAREAIAVAIDGIILCAALITLWVSFDLFNVALMAYTPILQISNAWIVLPFNVGLVMIALFAAERLLFHHAGRLVLTVVPVVILVIIAVTVIGSFPAARPALPTALMIMLPLFFVAVMLGLPVSFSMLIGSLFFLQITDAAPLIAAAQNTVDGTTHFILLTLPFFIWAGLIMEKGGISLRLVRFAMALVGHLRGGLLQVVVVTIYLVSGISGSKAADVVAVGSVLRRELKKQGYRPEEGAAVLSAAGAMSETIPPSIAMLVLGSVTPISIGTLFVAGLLPAAVIALFLMIAIYFLAWKRNTPRTARASATEFLSASGGAILPLIMPVIMIVGIKFGFATPTEVSAVAVFYGLALSTLGYRTIAFKNFFTIAVDCALLAGMVLFIIASAGSFAWTLTAANLPSALIRVLHLAGDSPTLFLIGSLVLLITIGSLLEGLPVLIILGPLLLPIATQLGIDSIHYAMVMLLAMGIGIFIPPIGICFYISCAVSEADVEATSKAMVPYLTVLILGVLAVAFVPWFTHIVPNLLGRAMTDSIDLCQGPDPNLRAARFKMPDGATDTHFHLFGPQSRYPLVDLREYTPQLITPQMAQDLFSTLGIQRAVVIQPSVYGDDNRAQLEGAAEIGIPIRAVVVAGSDASDDDLAALHRQGARGLRYVLAHPGGLPPADLERWADRIKTFGWHIQFLAKGPQILELASRIEKLSCPAVIDHMGMFQPAGGLDQPIFKAVLKLLERGHWVKLSGMYRLSRQNPPYPELAPFAARLISARPDRIVWASDWPHAFVKTPMPNTTDLLDTLAEWVPNEAARNRILVDNPAALYDF